MIVQAEICLATLPDICTVLQVSTWQDKDTDIFKHQDRIWIGYLIFSCHCCPQALADNLDTWRYLTALRSLALMLTPGLVQPRNVIAQEKHADPPQVEIHRPKNNGLCSVYHKVCIWHTFCLICVVQIPFFPNIAILASPLLWQAWPSDPLDRAEIFLLVTRWGLEKRFLPLCRETADLAYEECQWNSRPWNGCRSKLCVLDCFSQNFYSLVNMTIPAYRKCLALAI